MGVFIGARSDNSRMNVIVENCVSLNVLKRKMMTYRTHTPIINTKSSGIFRIEIVRFTISGYDSMNGSTRVERRTTSLIPMDMRSVVAQDRIRRLHKVRPEGDLVRHCAGRHEEGIFLAGEFGHVFLEG